jgi:hypothetical protein
VGGEPCSVAPPSRNCEKVARFLSKSGNCLDSCGFEPEIAKKSGSNISIRNGGVAILDYEMPSRCASGDLEIEW